jgi:hypothetical protein
MFKHVAGVGPVEMSPAEEADFIAGSNANDPVANPPELGAIDKATLNAALAAPGSFVRALGLVMFAEINKLRVANGDAAYTLTQFKSSLKAQMR